MFEPLPSAEGLRSGKPYPAFLTGKMAEVDVQELLAYALATGGLRDAKDSYDYLQIADASTTLFNVDAGGLSKHVSVYALMEETAVGADEADRNGLAKLAQRLSKFDNRSARGRCRLRRRVRPCRISRRRCSNSSAQGLAENVKVIEWPWPDLKPADFKGRLTVAVPRWS